MVLGIFVADVMAQIPLKRNREVGVFAADVTQMQLKCNESGILCCKAYPVSVLSSRSHAASPGWLVSSTV
jgi:hypothetical protein